MRGVRFAAQLVLQLWLAHALAFFAHEYGHSFTAWALGWKADPLTLNFGHATPLNLLLMTEINERVDYAPIFAAGAGWQAALIAAAGILTNFALYPLATFACLRLPPRRPGWALFAYWVAVMCVGNFLTYVPTRTFSPEDDMHTLERGLGASPWAVIIGLGVPFLAAGAHLFVRLLPKVRREVWDGDMLRAWVVTVVTTFLVFVFFALSGLEAGEGPVARGLALVSMALLFPLATFALRPARGALTP